MVAGKMALGNGREQKGQSHDRNSQQVMDQAEQLPPELQQMVAEQFQQVLDAVMSDARWEALLSDPHHKEVVRRMAQEALAEYQRSKHVAL